MAASGSGGIGNNFHKDVASPRAIKFAQKNPLPGAERQLAIFDEDRLVGAGKNRLHMRIGVTFRVTIRAFVRDQAVEDPFDVAGNIGIGVFVDDHARGGVRHVDITKPVLDPGIAYDLFHCAGDVDKLGATGGFDLQRCHSTAKRSRRGNNEVRAGVLHARMAFDFFKALLAPARRETQEA